MTPFSIRAVRAIESFAAHLGVQAQAGPDHSYGFEFAKSGRLSIASSEDGKRVILALARASDRVNASTHLQVLVLAGVDRLSGAMIHAGVAACGVLILAVAIEEEYFDTQAIDDSLSTLIRLHDSII
jgi:hypothetical protein